MQLAQQLAAKAAEARVKEAERTKPMLQARHGLTLLCSLWAGDQTCMGLYTPQ